MNPRIGTPRPAVRPRLYGYRGPYTAQGYETCARTARACGDRYVAVNLLRDLQKHVPRVSSTNTKQERQRAQPALHYVKHTCSRTHRCCKRAATAAGPGPIGRRGGPIPATTATATAGSGSLVGRGFCRCRSEDLLTPLARGGLAGLVHSTPALPPPARPCGAPAPLPFEGARTLPLLLPPARPSRSNCRAAFKAATAAAASAVAAGTPTPVPAPARPLAVGAPSREGGAALLTPASAAAALSAGPLAAPCLAPPAVPSPTFAPLAAPSPTVPPPPDVHVVHSFSQASAASSAVRPLRMSVRTKC